MVRTLLSSSLLALTLATGAHAGGLVPGSDTFARAADTAATVSVANGTSGWDDASPIRETRAYAYPLNGGDGRLVPGSEFFGEAVADADAHSLAVTRHDTGRPLGPTVSSQIVPGSGSF